LYIPHLEIVSVHRFFNTMFVICYIQSIYMMMKYFQFLDYQQLNTS